MQMSPLQDGNTKKNVCHGQPFPLCVVENMQPEKQAGLSQTIQGNSPNHLNGLASPRLPLPLPPPPSPPHRAASVTARLPPVLERSQ